VLPHQPVLLAEALAALDIRAEGRYVDATFGRGGHSAAILERLGPGGSLLALDRDPAAGDWARSHFRDPVRFQFVQTAFSRLADIIAERGLCGQMHGVLLDLGVSSPQLDDPARGFGFSQNGALDMRMDPTSGSSAADWVNRVSEGELERQRRRVRKGVDGVRRGTVSSTSCAGHRRSSTTGANRDHGATSGHRLFRHPHPRTRQTSGYSHVSGGSDRGQR